MDEIGHPHSMTYIERENLKTFASNGKCLAETMIMIAHWMRQTQDVTFSGYAANWVEANMKGRSIEPMQTNWPLTSQRFIADGSSEWGSAIPQP